MKPQPEPPESLRETALRLLNAGQKARQIAATLNVPIGKIYYWKRYYMNPLAPLEDGRRLYDDQFKRDVLDWITAGVSVSRLAHAFGVSKVTLFKWKREVSPSRTARVEAEMIRKTPRQEAFGGVLHTTAYFLERIQILEDERDALKKALHVLLDRN